MQVFKLCMKVYKKNFPVMMIYFGIFIAMSFMMSTVAGQQPAQGFEQSRASVALFSQEDTAIVQGLKDELAKIANFVEIKDDTSSIQDALYFRKVDYIIRLPIGFSEGMVKGEDVELQTTSVPQSSRSVYVDLRVNHYLNTLRLLASSSQERTLEELRLDVAEVLERETPVVRAEGEAIAQSSMSMNYSFNYLAYSMMFVLIMGMSVVLLILKQLEIKRRNAVAPISSASVNRQLIAASMVFTLGSWVLMVMISLGFNYKEIAGDHTVYFVLNSFIFTLSAASVSFLIGSLVKSREGISAVANMFTLGSAFLGGVFVPQFLLGETVLRFSSFLPVYWYVKANDRIATLGEFTFETLREVYGYMGIGVGFAVAFMVLALVIGKRRQLAIEE